MPPGPIPLPFVGNKFQMPVSKPWVKFQEWSKIYGPIFTVWSGRRPTLVISDPNVAVDLMEKRSQKYSSRPRLVVMGEIYGTPSVLVQPYGKEWSLRRKLLHRALTPAALRTYKARQEAEGVRLVNQVMQDPRNWEMAFERFTASVVFSVAYGHRIDSLDSKIIRKRLDLMQFMASLNVPGAYMAESFPILKYIPNILAPWKKKVEDHGREEGLANLELFEGLEEEVAGEKAGARQLPESLAKMLVELGEKEPIPLDKTDLSFVPAGLFGAGSDTTASTMCSAVLAFVTHPQALKTAQAEMDSVIGRDRMPTFADEENLPYIRALVKEVLRWRPVAVLGGTPHATSEDDVYQGWKIPKGTTILGNSWAINLNEEYYPDPQNFNPARFLDDSDARVARNLKGKPHPAKLGHSSFGWGRRICPGADIASNSLFIALASLIWALDFIPTTTYDTFDYTEGFNIRPRPFQCKIQIRSEQHKKALERQLNAANVEMEKFPAYE
ncbi:hypothetical protein B7463_g6479, partial [Scytalidium lignicola]